MKEYRDSEVQGTGYGQVIQGSDHPSGQVAKTLGGGEGLAVERCLREFIGQFFSNRLLPEENFLFLGVVEPES